MYEGITFFFSSEKESNNASVLNNENSKDNLHFEEIGEYNQLYEVEEIIQADKKKVYRAKGIETSEDLQIAIDKATLKAREKICQLLIKDKVIDKNQKEEKFEIILKNSRVVKESHKKIGKLFKASVTVEYIHNLK